MNERDTGKEAQLPASPLDVLKIAASKISELEIEAKQAAYVEGDDDKREKALREIANTVLNLPNELRKLAERGISVPERISDWSIYRAAIAREAVENGGTFIMSVVLTDRGSRGGPNELEKFIIRLENPQAPR